MKTFLLFSWNTLRLMLVSVFVSLSALSSAQTSANLVFENDSLESGTALANNAVYLFRNVNNALDARIKITGRSSSLVQILDIDVHNVGHNKAFQPQIQYNNGETNSATSWWVEFEIKFYNKATSTPATITQAYATALDIDGNNTTLREWNAFYGATSYTLENNTQLAVSWVTGILGQLNLLGNKFLGTTTDYPGIDTSATQLMTTNYFQNMNTITFRLGAQTSAAASNTSRMYSVWFRDFNYNAPMNTLPVKLNSFTATLEKDKAELKWVTSTEINMSHFVVERSTDGKSFAEAGILFSYGSATENTNYSFSDNLVNIVTPIVYYRLRSVDIDGKIQYSETRIIRLNKANASTLMITTFPNPANNEVKVTIPFAWQNKKVSYEVLSLNGIIVSSLQTNAGSQTESLDLSKLAPGFYLVRAVCENESAQQKIVKQ